VTTEFDKESSPTVPRFRVAGSDLLKMSATGLIIGYLVYSGRIDFSKLGLVFSSPFVLGMALSVFFLGGLFAGGIRWWLLLWAAGVHLSKVRVIAISWIGIFFNVVMPGSVGGDVIKAIYVMKEAPKIPKTNVMMTLLLDRVFGLAGLFVFCGVNILTHLDAVYANPEIEHLASFLLIAIAVVLWLLLVVFIPLPLVILKFIERYAGRDTGVKILKPFGNIFNAMRLYRSHAGSVVAAIAISAVLQAFYMIYAWQIAQLVSEQNTDFVSFSVAFPLGILMSAIPLAPGGLGVGHVAFENLFRLVGLVRGADVFNVVVLSQLALSLTGAIPYALLKKKKSAVEVTGTAS
jgi:uncharacterized protein (TIRG00374 family)